MLKGLEKTMNRSPNLKFLMEIHSGEIREECLSILKGSGRQVRQISRLHLFASPDSKEEVGQNAA